MALTKILNDENKSFQPVLTDKLVYDTKPTVNSFNGITSDAVARAIAGASGEVPAVTEADNGKVLTAVYDEGGSAVEWADAQGGAEYSAGTGISISAQDEISVDTTVIATKNDLSSYQPTISDLETIRSGASAGATAVQPGSLATVATSGSYNDLSGKPTIPAAQVNSDWNAASGVSQILNKPSLATVATSGSYADLSNKPTIPTVDQTYNSASTNAQSGTAVAGALATVNQVPASTSADEDKVLTVNSSGTPVWAAAQGGGSSYTFSAPLRESAGTVVLDVDTDELDIAPKTTTLSMQRSMSGAGNNGYCLYVGNLVTDTSGNVYTFTFDHVPVPSDVTVGVQAQGKKLYPLLVGQTYGDYGNQWIIPTALTLDYQGKVNGSFSVCFKPGEQDYPTSLTSGANLNSVAALVFVLSDMSGAVPSAQVNPSSIYGSTTEGSTVNYSTGGSMLMVKHPVPSFSTSTDAGKVLTVGSSGLEWINSVPIEVVASMPASPTSGVLYIVTGA